MKTETQIAQDFIEKIKREELPEMTQANISGLIIGHKLTLQRNLQKWINLFNLLKEKRELKTWVNAYLGNEVEDIKNAIKRYDEAGI